MKRINAYIGAFVILTVCVSIADAEPSYVQLSGASQDSPSGNPMPHSNHIPQHGGVFFMALDNEHHLEGVFLKSGIFRVYLYDAFTRPLAASEVQKAIGDVQVGESESAPKIPLLVGKDVRTLEGAVGKGLKLPVTINLSLRFQQSEENVKPEVFTLRFSHYIAEDAQPQPLVPMDVRIVTLYTYLCIFLSGGIGILIVTDRMAMQADRRLSDDAKIQGTLWSRSGLKHGEIFRLWRVHRKLFPNSSLRFSCVALWVLTLSWLFFGLNLLQRWTVHWTVQWN